MPENVKTIEEVLLETGKYIGPTVGTSMLPMLKNRRDTIVVKAKTERLKPLDVALYKRGNLYILHRVLKVTDTGYIIRGDNCYYDEIVPEEDVIGVLTEFFRKKTHYYCTDEKYLKYVKKRIKHYKSRRFFVLTWRKIVAGVKKPIKWILRWDKRKK
ncbi:MAG: S24/S26 family peptidase [Clostridia bacterium]|nr:S24/S26 family peptidase [Clostridia bacterium]